MMLPIRALIQWMSHHGLDCRNYEIEIKCKSFGAQIALTSTISRESQLTQVSDGLPFNMKSCSIMSMPITFTHPPD